MEDQIPQDFVAITRQSAYGRHNGPFYRKDVPEGFVWAFRVLDRHLNAAGIVHGGMLATFMDIVLGHAVISTCGQPAFTVRMGTDFVGPAKLGDWLEGRARVTRRMRTLAFVEGAIETHGRKVVAGSGVFRLVDRPQD